MNLLKFRVILTVLCCGSAPDQAVSSPVEEKYNLPTQVYAQYGIICSNNNDCYNHPVTLTIPTHY